MSFQIFCEIRSLKSLLPINLFSLISFRNTISISSSRISLKRIMIGQFSFSKIFQRMRRTRRMRRRSSLRPTMVHEFHQSFENMISKKLVALLLDKHFASAASFQLNGNKAWKKYREASKEIIFNKTMRDKELPHQLRREQLDCKDLRSASFRALCPNNFEDSSFAENSFKEETFTEETFTEESFAATSLEDETFSEQSLEESSLTKSNFTENSFEKSTFKEETFKEETFLEESFDNSSLKEETFSDTSLGEETFSESSFENSSFAASSFTEETFEEGTFDNSSLEASNFEESSFEESSFDTSSFEESNFNTSSFEESSFGISSFDKHSFYKSSLEESSLKPNSFEDSSFDDSSFQEASLNSKSFQSTALTTELAQLQRRTLTLELAELARPALHTEPEQLTEPSFQSLEFSPAQLCRKGSLRAPFGQRSFSLLSGTKLFTAWPQGGVLRRQLLSTSLPSLLDSFCLTLPRCGSSLPSGASSKGSFVSPLSSLGFGHVWSLSYLKPAF